MKRSRFPELLDVLTVMTGRAGPAAARTATDQARRARGHAPWDDYEPASSEQAFWYRYDERPALDAANSIRWPSSRCVTLCRAR